TSLALPYSHLSPLLSYSFFLFNDTSTTEIYTLSLHDALPIYHRLCHSRSGRGDDARRPGGGDESRPHRADRDAQRSLSRGRRAVRRWLHRLAGDELPPPPAGGGPRRFTRAAARRPHAAGAAR